MNQENLIGQLLENFAKQSKSGRPYPVVEIHKSPDDTIITTETPIVRSRDGGQRLAHEKSTTISEPKK